MQVEDLEQILARSQVEDLIRWKSVCKSWNSLISSRRFVKSHLSYNLKRKADYNETGDTRIDFDSNNRLFYRLVGSSNGLVCFHDRDGDKLFVINPSTREVKELGPSPLHRGIEVSGFGYDSSIDDFKVVVGFSDGDDDNFFFKVLSLKSNVWRSVPGEVEGWPLFKNGHTYGTLCNGVIHWLFRGNVIITFDLFKEVIREIPQPDPPCDRFQGYRLHNNYIYKLGTIKDRLCIIYENINNFRLEEADESEEIETWVMKNYNVMKPEGIEIERWLPPPGYDEHKTITKYTPHDSFFYGHIHIWMLEEGSGAPVLVHSLENPNQNTHIKLSTISECNHNFDRPVFVKSLVSPHGMGDDYSGNGGSFTPVLQEDGRLRRSKRRKKSKPI